MRVAFASVGLLFVLVVGGSPDTAWEVDLDFREGNSALKREVGVRLSEVQGSIVTALQAGNLDNAEKAVLQLEDLSKKAPYGNLSMYYRDRAVQALFDAQLFPKVCWLCEHPRLGIGDDPARAKRPVALSQYLVSVVKTRGMESARELHERMRANLDREVRWLDGWLRVAWIDARVAGGEASVREELKDLARLVSSERELTSSSAEYVALRVLCLKEREYDLLRNVLLQAVVEGRTSTRSVVGEHGLTGIARMDGQGYAHLAHLVKGISESYSDRRARMRGSFLLAEFYRLAALEQYKEIMWDGAADEVPAGPLDLPAVLTHEPTEPPEGRHEIKFDYGKLTSRSLSQQSAFYVPRLAPGSQTRKWEFGVLDRETKERLQSELWRKSREKEGK